VIKLLKYFILAIILALYVYALLPPAKGEKQAHLGSDPNRNKDKPASVKYVLRINPGPLYLPGVIPENSKTPIEGIQKVADTF